MPFQNNWAKFVLTPIVNSGIPSGCNLRPRFLLLVVPVLSLCMAGIDDNVAIIGDWVPPSPSPRTFFSAMLGEDIGSRPLVSEPPSSNRSEGLFLGRPPDQMVSGNRAVNNNGTLQGCLSSDKLTEFGSFSEQKSGSRGGLVERMAARAGFNAPRLNTESIRSADLSLSSDNRSPYITIPPGLSPTTLLDVDSPVFLSNSLVSLRFFYLFGF